MYEALNVVMIQLLMSLDKSTTSSKTSGRLAKSVLHVTPASQV